MKKVRAAFNKLTLFDKALIIIAILGFAFFAYVFFRKATYISATIKVGEDDIRLVGADSRVWFAQLFREGMKETDGLGRVGAEVISIYSYDTLPSRKAVYLTTNLRAVYNRASNQYTFKGVPLSVGSKIKLNLDRLLVEGLVTHIEGLANERVGVKLLVEAKLKSENSTYLETSGVEPYVADAIEKGQEIKDSQGKVIIKVVNKRDEDAKRLTTTAGGGVLVQKNPLRRDVYLALEVNAIKIGDGYYLFDDIPILIGSSIPIKTPTVSVFPEVTNIKFE